MTGKTQGWYNLLKERNAHQDGEPWGMPAHSLRPQYYQTYWYNIYYQPRSKQQQPLTSPSTPPTDLVEAQWHSGYRVGWSYSYTRIPTLKAVWISWKTDVQTVFYPVRGQYLCCPRKFFSFQKHQESWTMLKHTNTNKKRPVGMHVFTATSFSL